MTLAALSATCRRPLSGFTQGPLVTPSPSSSLCRLQAGVQPVQAAQRGLVGLAKHVHGADHEAAVGQRNAVVQPQVGAAGLDPGQRAQLPVAQVQRRDLLLQRQHDGVAVRRR